MASSFTLPVPAPLETHTANASEKWKRFKLAWTNYSLATELTKKSQGDQVATLLVVIGEEAHEVYSTFRDWADEGDENKVIRQILQFNIFCSFLPNLSVS